MKSKGLLKELFADVKIKISAGIIAGILLVLGITAIVNPSLLKGLFGYSGEGLMGDYVVNTGQTIDVYKHLENLKKAELEKAQGTPVSIAPDRTMGEKELFGLDAIQEVEGVQYAAILFYDANDTAWRGYITKAQLDSMTTKNSTSDFVVLFMDDNGKELARQALKSGEKATALNPFRTGFALEGWYNNGTEWNFNTGVTSDLILKAKWEPISPCSGSSCPDNRFKVSFNLDGGTLNGKTTIEEQRILSGQRVANPGNPTKTGFTFKGWMPNGGTTRWEFPTDVVTGEVSLVASWEETGTTCTGSNCDATVNITVTDNTTNKATGWSKNDVVVTVVATVTGNGDSLASQPYSFDGGENWQAGNTKTFTESADITIKVRTTKEVEAEKAHSIKIDKAKPAVPTYELKTAEGNPYTGTQTSQVITLSNIASEDEGDSGIERYEYSTGCTATSNWAPAQAQYTYDPKNGPIIASYCLRAVDKAGNVSDPTPKFDIKTAIITIDIPPFDVKGAPTKWTNQDVTLNAVVASDQLSQVGGYSFDDGKTWQTASSKKFTTNGTIKVKIKTKATPEVPAKISAAQTVVIDKIDKTDPVVKVTKYASTASGGNGVDAIYWVRVEVDDAKSNVYVTGSYRYSTSDWERLNGIYTKVWENSKGASAAGASYIHLWGDGNKWRPSVVGYYKLQGYKGSTKSRAYIVAKDEAGNKSEANYPSATTWFSK